MCIKYWLREAERARVAPPCYYAGMGLLVTCLRGCRLLSIRSDRSAEAQTEGEVLALFSLLFDLYGHGQTLNASICLDNHIKSHA